MHYTLCYNINMKRKKTYSFRYDEDTIEALREQYGSLSNALHEAIQQIINQEDTNTDNQDLIKLKEAIKILMRD